MKQNKHARRMILYLAQGGCCFYCGDAMSMNRKKNGGPARDFATFEHLVRKEHGGTLDDCVLAHSRCNLMANIAWQKQQKALRKNGGRERTPPSVAETPLTLKPYAPIETADTSPNATSASSI